ncbi:MAG: ATP-dependent Clp protease ATP-binding subunit ClpX [Chitinivibrionales bacterium]|nr:ATP-dependent Clp protease ATP-binding subunit ClpX [Chitinivibrionales bacterium]
MAQSTKYSSVRCSFCGKSANEVEKIITGPSVYICNECVQMCMTILGDERSKTPGNLSVENLPTPAEMKTFLDTYIIGQNEAKRGVCVAAYNHYKRVLSRTIQTGDDVEIEKSNIMLLGPTGTGKTLIAQTLARMLKVPFTIVDSTVFTEAGYVGEDVENMLVRLLQAADYDLSKAEKGIIYIDEFDKIAKKSPSPSITRDVSGEGVQQAMLKILEGTISNIPPKGGRKHPEQNYIQINTRDILFICGGAFVGIEDIIERRTGQSRMGFTAPMNSAEKSLGAMMKQVEPDDLIQFGMIPEIIGRIPAVFVLDELDSDALLRVLTEPKNALIKQYKKLFSLENVNVIFAQEALHEVVSTAIRKKTGARGLRNVLENALLPIMFDIPSKKDIREVLITRDVIRREAEPVFTVEKKKKSA